MSVIVFNDFVYSLHEVVMVEPPFKLVAHIAKEPIVLRNIFPLLFLRDNVVSCESSFPSTVRADTEPIFLRVQWTPWETYLYERFCPIEIYPYHALLLLFS